MRFEKYSGLVFLFIGLVAIAAQADFSPERIYKVRSKTSLDYGWKFYQGVPSGTPSATSYNDAAAGWTTVNIPHSASYDDPLPIVINNTTKGEGGRYQGICWYRKTFNVPAGATHRGKILLQFDGAMQVAAVWLNGQLLGTHSSSGYTWFQFDITQQVSLTGPNVLAVQLDNRPSLTIPPGRTTADGVADYFLYSGMYRNVWLVCTDQCRIPLYGQKLTTPAGGAGVHITTPVISSTPGSIRVHYIIAYGATWPVAHGDQTLSLSSAGTATFDTLIPLPNAALWTEKTPNLYTVYTQVFRNDTLVDDYVDRFGVRWLTWTSSGGFSLNGVLDTLKGVSLHQSMGWIESAMPRSRLHKEVALVKQMGANMIRCAHFPRDPAFYDACDELGLLAMVEVPTWGCCLTGGWTYPDSLFLRLDTCMREMIEVGYNHPSIIGWGVFNEPPAAYNLPQQIPSEDSIAHRMDQTRYTYLASNTLGDAGIAQAADVAGMNYGEWTGTAAKLPLRVINTEYHEGWLYTCFRGGTSGSLGGGVAQFSDDLSSGGYAMQAWNDWLNLWNTVRFNKLAGGCLWAFNDYWSEHGSMNGVFPMGAVDHFRIPKAMYYLYRKYWTGVPDSVPVPSLTPATLRLDCDTNSLVADSTDISVITASLKAADGRCVDNTNVGKNTDTIQVVFSVSGPANRFGSDTAKLFGGKAGFMIKSTNTPGPITITATALKNGKELTANLTATPITIQSKVADTTPLPFLTPVVYRGAGAAQQRYIAIKQLRNSIVVTFAGKFRKSDVKLVDFRGADVSCPVSMTPSGLTLNTRDLASGCYLLSAGNSVTGSMTRKISIIR